MTVIEMKAYTYIEKGRFELQEKPKPELQECIREQLYRSERWMGTWLPY